MRYCASARMIQQECYKQQRYSTSPKYNTVYKIMKDYDLMAPPTRKGRRKWVSFERMYSNAMWHVDLHIMKSKKWAGMKPCSIPG